MFSVEVESLHKRFGSTHVLNGISFSFGGGVFGVGGSNGSGKSTLLKCLAGLLSPTSGNIKWEQYGEAISNSSLKKHLGFVAPYINLYHELSVRENLQLILQLRRRPFDQDHVDKLWQRLQLSELQDKAFGDLSTGQQQRARLACTLSYEPSILFLDEPGANLDEQGRAAIRHILDEFRREEKMILLASNDPQELDLTDRILSVDED